MVRRLLVRGMFAGLLAGLLAFGFGRVLGEPAVERAIAFEAAMDAARDGVHEHGRAENGHADEEVVVSRPVQAGAGLLTAVVVYGAAFGGLFALVFAAVHGRAGSLPPRATAALLAGTGFVTVYLVPSLKYPANPPAVGEADTIGQRTALFFAMLAISVAAAVVAGMLRKPLAARLGAWNAALVAGAAYLVPVVIAAALLPAVNEVPEGFPAALLWQFRLASAGMQLVMWTVLGLAFGALAERVLAPENSLIPGGQARFRV